ncbi:MAG TPA: hypothetical protein VHA37_02845 [Candidatus Saccharimonadales bacterium]|nr:hypothetical protein [Candidatus Saccharimonadales bacterium]
MAAAHNKHRQHPILKLGLRLTIFSLVVVGVGVIFGGGGKVMAAGLPTSCPSAVGTNGFNQANDRHWGVPVKEDGPDGGNMAGLVIQAYDATNNKPVDIRYTLKSGVTGPNSNYVWVPITNPSTPGYPGYSYDYNARIFNATNVDNGETDFTNRQRSYTSGTGDVGQNLNGVNIADDSGDGWTCSGWDAFGPQNTGSDMAGNGHVLDCGPLVSDPSAPSGSVKQHTEFWFENLSDRPQVPGDDGDKGKNGYWSVDISSGNNTDPGINTDIHIDHWNGSQMGFNTNMASNASGITGNNSPSNGPLEFNVSNGANTYVQFIWHPTTPPPSTGHSVDSTSTCQYVKVDESHTGTGNRTRVWVEVDGPIALGKSKYTDNSGVGHWTPDSSDGSVHYGDPGQPAPPGSVASWVGPGTETGDPADGDSGDLSVSKEWWWQPQANSITVTVRTDNLPKTWDAAKDKYDYVNSSWNNGTPQTTTYDCFADSTCTTALTVDGDLPGSKIEAGHNMHVSGTYKNTGQLPLWNPSVYAPDGNYYPVSVSGGVLNPGDTASFSFTMTAPNQVEYDNVGITSYYYGQMANGSSCDAHTTVPIYQWFQAGLTASSTLKPTTEHPYQGDDYYTNISVQQASSQSVYIPTSSSFYKQAAGGGTATYAGPANSSGPYGSAPTSPGATTTTLAGHYDIPAGSYVAGDEYCAHTHADYTTGYVGPDSTVVGPGNPADQTSCPRVVNEPYFKVENGMISAGGEFDQCSTSGGTLAGYADVSDPVGATRGASSELSSLALIKITGVASAQSPSSITRSPTGLTFANTGSGVQVDSSGSESPTLGGNFGGCVQITNASAPTSAHALPSSSTSASLASGSYTYGSGSGSKLTINGGTLSAGQAVSIFVNGDVNITQPITYAQTTGWTPGTAPSFILHATGNIYISPNVTSLAGVYIAQKSGSNGGKIYTCADGTGFAPVSAQNLYPTCSNQLVVYGSFVADQVNLMRSYGSLRDEEPNPAVGGTPGTPGSPQIGLAWSSAGPIAGYNCVHIDEPSDPHTWDDNYLCEDPHYSVALAWTHDAGNPSPSYNPYDGWDTQADIQAKGYPYCTAWNVPDPDTWYDNVLCANQNIGLTFSTTNLTSATENCTNISESADPDANWSHGGYWLCAQYSAGTPGTSGSPPTPKGPPYNTCSNQGAEIDNKSCAGEIFEFSPELYLSNPAIPPPGGSGGPLQFQSLNSLPPVL